MKKKAHGLPPLDGFVEGTDYKVVKGLRVPLKANEDRTCRACQLFLPKSSFYSSLHPSCRKCVRDSDQSAVACRDVAGRPKRPTLGGKGRQSTSKKRADAAALARTHLLTGAAVEVPPELASFYAKELAKLRARQEKRGTPAAAAARALSPVEVTQQQKEMAQRVLCRRRLIQYVKRFNPTYLAGWVHDDIARRLERFMEQVERGESPRLLLGLPPRTGKSKLASEEFVSWGVGRHPDWEWISSSYNVTLPQTFSRRIRDRIKDPAYKAIFPTVELRDDSQSIEVWQTTAGGAYRAAGVGGGITGQGARVAIVDDPIKNWEEADSVVIRDALWDWYLSTLYSRLAPGGGVLIIQTLWNDDDLAGRLQAAEKEGGDKFEVVLYPAINETHDEYLAADEREILRVPPGQPAPEGAKLLRPVGTALHPERYSLDELRAKQRNYTALGQKRMWSALYQQNPIPEEGLQFTRDMFDYVAGVPNKTGMDVYQAWDFAITEKQTSDWTVCYTFAYDWNGHLHELGVLRFRSGDNTVIADAIVDQHLLHNPTVVGFEDGQIWKSIKATVLARAEERKVKSFNYYENRPLTDKKVRAAPLRGQMQLHRVHFQKDAAWREMVDSEFLRFPGGKHDDIVDAAAWCARTALEHSKPNNPETLALRDYNTKKLKSWQDKLASLANGSPDATHMAA
jgi:phage terminase large subunit-like protein